MLSNSVLINKSRGLDIPSDKRHKLPHCSKNATKIEGLLFCQKCVEERRRGRNRRFTNCRQLFHHLTICNSGMDLNEYPSRDNCIEMLQVISNAIILGVLK